MFVNKPTFSLYYHCICDLRLQKKAVALGIPRRRPFFICPLHRSADTPERTGCQPHRWSAPGFVWRTFGGGEESRTPVRKQFHETFSGRRRLFRATLPPCSPPGGQAVTPAGQVSFMMHGTGKAYRTHVHRSMTSFRSRGPLRLDGRQQSGGDS